MSTAKLNLKLFREIDSLEKSKLEQISGLVLNFINDDNDTEEWNTPTPSHQKGQLDPIVEMNSTEGIDHATLMDKFKKSMLKPIKWPSYAADDLSNF